MRDKGLRINKDEFVEIDHAIPTLSHMSITKLVEENFVKHVVSTNLDGLHLRSGLAPEKLSELHGNCYLEICEVCKEIYFRQYDVTKTQTRETFDINKHFTGRYCEKEGCGGKLLDNIVHFGEQLPDDALDRAQEESNTGDLAIVVGTSMRVEPSCSLPRSIYKKSGGKMVIINLQRTPYDEVSEFVIRGHIDDVFNIVMRELGMEIAMKTPEGYDVTPYVDNVDQKHTENKGKSERLLAEIRSKQYLLDINQ